MACAEAVNYESFSSDLLNCPICYETFKNPRILPCLHTFCEECLEKHIQNDSMQLWSKFVGGSFACPTCREMIAIPLTGIAGFRKDFKVTKIKELLEKSAMNGSHLDYSSSSSLSSEKVNAKSEHCEFCSVANITVDALHYCLNCTKSLCSKCAEKHKNRYLFTNHSIIPRDSSQEGAAGVRCWHHKSELVSYFCLKCTTAVCTLCTVTHHDNHAMTELTVGVKGLIENLTVLQKSTQGKLSLLEAELSDMHIQENHLEYVYEQSCSSVRRRTEALIKYIKEKEFLLLKELELRYRNQREQSASHKNELEVNVTSLRSLTEFTSTLLSNNSSTKMIDLYKDLGSRMETLLEQNLPQKQNQTVQYNVFIPSQSQIKIGKIKLAKVRGASSIGSGISRSQDDSMDETNSSSCSKIYKLVSQPNIQSLATFGRNGARSGEFNSPRDLCFLNDTTLVIADTNNDRLQLFEVNGSFIRTIGQDQIKPWGVAACADGNIVVADALDKCVKIFSQDDRLIRKIGNFLCPCGVCVNQAGEIVVTDFFSNTVQFINKDGQKLRHFDFRTRTDQYSTGASRVVCDSENRVIISDMSNKCVKVFNKNGKLLHTMNHADELVSPQGVCVDRNNHIVVADLSSHQVSLHSPDGHYSHIILAKAQGMKDPTGVAMSRTGLLAVTQAKVGVVKTFSVKSGSNTLLMRLPGSHFSPQISGENVDISE